ncbi:hypothetical protein LA080_007788 [Diaporthe eres]|nr:hypothetical protein LA080_007788 [Diaporthe eres]
MVSFFTTLIQSPIYHSSLIYTLAIWHLNRMHRKNTLNQPTGGSVIRIVYICAAVRGNQRTPPSNSTNPTHILIS